MRRLRTVPLIVALAVALAAATAAPAAAVEFTFTQGQTFTVNWECRDGNCQWDSAGGSYLPLTAEGDFTLTQLTSTEAWFDVRLTNTWNDPSTTLFLTGIGFNVQPDITGVRLESPGQYFTSLTHNEMFPGFQRLDVCADTSSNGSCGAGNAGIPEALTDSFTLVLLGSFTDTVTLDSFAVKMAGEPSSYEFGAVPEPATMLLFGTGLLGAALLVGRRRR